MSEIDELQRRLTTAMDRIGQGLGALSAPDGASNDAGQAVDDLKKSLDEALAAKAGLEKRLADLAHEADRLRQSNEELRELSHALRAANQNKLADPDLIDRVMASELEALRSAQAVSEAEARAILDALAPLLKSDATKEAQ